MTMKDIEEAKKKTKAELFISFKKFCIFNTLLWIIMSLGSIIFFYIEACYYFIPDENSSDQYSSQELCNSILVINTMHSNNSEILKAISNVTAFCNQQKLKPHQAFRPTIKHRCDFDTTAFAVWMSYMVTVVFTIGKNYVYLEPLTFKLYLTAIHSVTTAPSHKIDFIHLG